MEASTQVPEGYTTCRAYRRMHTDLLFQPSYHALRALIMVCFALYRWQAVVPLVHTRRGGLRYQRGVLWYPLQSANEGRHTGGRQDVDQVLDCTTHVHCLNSLAFSRHPRSQSLWLLTARCLYS